MIELRDRLILPLDVPSTDEAEAIVASLGDAVSFYKIGLQLFPVGGADLALRLSAAGKRVFLDFKFHDIGATVEKATKSARTLNADLLTVHAEADVVKAAVEGRADDARLKVLAVTVLTSLTQESVARAGIDMPLADLVLRRAEIAAENGADGVVASPQEAEAIRARFGDRLIIVTPGVRPAGASLDDQQRVATPAAAIKAGADYLVCGRPVLGAPDRKAAAKAILEEAASAL